MNETRRGTNQLHRATARSLAEATVRALRVAGEDEDGDPASMSQKDLSEAADVSRTRVAQLLAGPTAEELPNPTLESICAIAQALKVPPAFLLMRSEDWAALATGFVEFLKSSADETLTSELEKLYALDAPSPMTAARAAMDLGTATSTLENEHDSRASAEIRQFRKSAKQATAAIAASIPFRYQGVSSTHIPLLLCACSIVGTVTAKANQ